MNEDRIYLTKEQAWSLMAVQEDGHVHTQKQSGMMFLGCDWTKDAVEQALDSAETIEIGGENCKAMKHGIVVIPRGVKYQSEILFFEHDEKKLREFEANPTLIG